MDLKNKSVTVIGLGNSGKNAALLLRALGAKVSASDSHDTPQILRTAGELRKKGIAVETGGHTKDFIKARDLIVVSPCVEDSSPAIRWADELKIEIIGEMELGFNFCKGKIIAITGTNGKSTVTSLIGEILKAGKKDAVVCGNIGNSLCGEIRRIKEETWVVLEVSSFQLERIVNFKPHIAVLLNITDDHMDRYRRFDDYFKAKLKVFQNQTRDDILILNHDAESLRALKDSARPRVLFYSKSDIFKGLESGAYVNGTEVISVFDGVHKSLGSIQGMRLKGVHNIENALVSALVGEIAGVAPGTIINTIRGFHGLEHRFETVDIIDGVEYIDDSKGTTVDSTYRALESCTKPVVLIAGGKDKNSDYSAVKDLVKKKVKSLVLIGEAREKIKGVLAETVKTYESKNMADAVRTAYLLSEEGDIVLLSPMCSSFDMFKNYAERGEVFKKAVGALKKFARDTVKI